MPKQALHHLQALRESHYKRLQILQTQQAIRGISTPPEIIIEIADIEGKIAQIDKEIYGLRPTTSNPKSKSQKSFSSELLSSHHDTDRTGYYDFTFGYKSFMEQIADIRDMAIDIINQNSVSCSMNDSERQRLIGFVLVALGLFGMLCFLFLGISFWPILIGGAVIVIVGVLSLSRRYTVSEMTVDVFDEGIQITSQGITKDVFWEDITKIYHTTVMSERYKEELVEVYFINYKNKFGCQFNSSLTGRSELSRIIEEETTDRLKKKVWGDYRNLKPVRFGEHITIKDGILRFGDVNLNLSDIHSIEIEEDKIFLRKIGLFNPKIQSTVNLRMTPNALIFKSLIYEIIGKNTDVK